MMKNYTSNAVLWLFAIAMPIMMNAQMSYVDSLKVDDKVRLFRYTKPKENSGKAKIIFVLHGSGMGMDFMEEVVGGQFNTLALEDSNTIIVYPEGFKGNWNDCRAKATYPAKLENSNDVTFLLDIKKRLKRKFNFDDLDVYAVGYSNGGHMCFKLAKVASSEFKGFAVVGANLPVSDNDDCTSSHKAVSMLLINGTTDPINPYGGGEVWSGDGQTRGCVMSLEATRDYWLGLLPGESKLESKIDYEDTYPKDNSRAVQRTYSSFGSSIKVSTLEIVNGGHHFANPDFKDWPHYLGNLNQDVNLPEIIMTFFESI